MPQFTLNRNVPIDTNEYLLIFLLNQVELFEQELFSHNEIVQTNFTKWVIDLEEGESIDIQPPMFGSQQPNIRMGKNFLKRVYKTAFYLIDFYHANIANQQIQNYKNLVDLIKKSTDEYFKNDDIKWDEIQSKRMATDPYLKGYMPVDFIFFYAFHFIISHEMGHSIHPGNGWQVEELCDNEGCNVLLNLAHKANSNQTFDCVEYIIVGLLFAQIFIASKTKQSVLDGEENDSSTHPFTFDRILNAINKIIHPSNSILFSNANGQGKRVLDDYFAYVFIALLFIYHKINYAPFLNNSYSFKELITSLLKYYHNERELLDSKRKRCPDELIGFIENKNNQWFFSRRRDYKQLFVFANEYRDYYKDKGECSVGKPIVFVLESPHKAEFFRKGIKVYSHKANTFARPSNGYTKRMFDKFINDILSNLGIPLDNQKHPVIIMNASQFQCSFGKITSLYRSWVFKKVFEGSLFKCNKVLLQKRLEEILPWHVICACTKGDDCKYEIRKAVDQQILSGPYPFTKAYHPSSWRKASYRIKRP